VAAPAAPVVAEVVVYAAPEAACIAAQVVTAQVEVVLAFAPEAYIDAPAANPAPANLRTACVLPGSQPVWSPQGQAALPLDVIRPRLTRSA